MKITFGRIAFVAGVIAALGVGVWSFSPRPIPVETATVTQGKFLATVDEDGKTHIRERYVIAAPLAGRLGRVRLKAGDTVKADDVVREHPARTSGLSRSAEPCSGGGAAGQCRGVAGTSQGAG